MEQEDEEQAVLNSDGVDFDDGDEEWVDDESMSIDGDEAAPSTSNNESYTTGSSSNDESDTSSAEETSDGVFTEYFPGAAKTFGYGKDSLSQIAEDDEFSEKRKANRFYPFSCETEWELALWLTRLDAPMSAVDEFLKTKFVRLISPIHPLFR